MIDNQKKIVKNKKVSEFLLKLSDLLDEYNAELVSRVIWGEESTIVLFVDGKEYDLASRYGFSVESTKDKQFTDVIQVLKEHFEKEGKQ
jgi:hypothetical protein